MKQFEQGSLLWHKWRLEGIGASEAASILGVGYDSPFQVWSQKLELSEPKVSNRAMDRGTELEPWARHKFNETMGTNVEPCLRQHKEYDWMRCSLDGYCPIDNIAVEIKVPGHENHQLAMNGIVPECYKPQLQHQLAVTGLDFIYYYSYDTTSQCIPIKVYRDEDYINMLIKKEREFWENHVLTFIPPPMTDKDYKKQTSEEWAQLASNWRSVRAQLQELESHEETLRRQLVSICEKQSSVGAGIRLSKVLRKGNVNYKLIPELKDVNLDKFRGSPIETWRFTEEKEQ